MAPKPKIIIWNNRPQQQLRELLTYHLENHSYTATENFLKRLEAKSKSIRKLVN